MVLLLLFKLFLGYAQILARLVVVRILAKRVFVHIHCACKIIVVERYVAEIVECLARQIGVESVFAELPQDFRGILDGIVSAVGIGRSALAYQ